MKIISNKKFLIGLLFVSIIVFLRFSGFFDGITIRTIQEKRIYLMDFIEKNYTFSVLLYIGFYIAVISLALPLAALSTIVGGFLFGVIPTTVYANIGATVGGALFFLMVRYLFGSSLQKRYADKLVWFNKEMQEYGIMYLFAIHLVAVIPFFIVNTLIGLTNIRLWTFIWTTSLSIIPGTMVYAFAGRELAAMTSIRDIFSPGILTAFGLLALLAIIPVVLKKSALWGYDNRV